MRESLNSFHSWIVLHWIVFWYVPRRCVVAFSGCTPTLVDTARRVLSRHRPHVSVTKESSEATVVVVHGPRTSSPGDDRRQIVITMNAFPHPMRDVMGVGCNRRHVSFWHGYRIDEHHSAEYTVEMFDEVAKTYDRATHRLSLGRDASWKRHLVAPIALSSTDVVVDLGCGTGDMLELIRTADCTRVGIDVSPCMLEHAVERVPEATFRCQSADRPYGVCATHVLAGYLFRNVERPSAVLTTAHECMCEGAQLHILDMFRPNVFAHVRVFVIGLWCHLQDVVFGHTHGAYGYIPESILNFMTVEEFCQLAHECGFRTQSVDSRLFGAAHIVRLKRMTNKTISSPNPHEKSSLMSKPLNFFTSRVRRP